MPKSTIEMIPSRPSIRSRERGRRVQRRDLAGDRGHDGVVVGAHRPAEDVLAGRRADVGDGNVTHHEVLRQRGGLPGLEDRDVPDVPQDVVVDADVVQRGVARVRDDVGVGHGRADRHRVLVHRLTISIAGWIRSVTQLARASTGTRLPTPEPFAVTSLTSGVRIAVRHHVVEVVRLGRTPRARPRRIRTGRRGSCP